MKIRMLDTALVTYANSQKQPVPQLAGKGEVIDVPSEVAAELIKNKVAEAVQVVETAVLKPKKATACDRTQTLDSRD
jgi:hypothetical protein